VAADDNEADLVEKLRNGDPQALAAAYDRYGKAAYSLFVRITRDHGVSEDLVQELFLRLWNRAHQFDPGRGALGVWLLSVARNMAIDYVRSARTKFQAGHRPLDQTNATAISYKPREPENVIDNAKAVREALAELSPNQRKALELAYFEGFSQTEIAAQLSAPLGTVKSWMRSALERLRKAIQGGVKP